MPDPSSRGSTALMKKLLFLALTFIVAAHVAAQNSEPNKLPKMSAEEIISKHLASIGDQSTLASVKSRIMVGVGVFTAKTRAGRIGGPAQLASTGDKFLLAVMLNSNDYPYEKVGFDGKDVTTGILPDGGLSPLAEFLKSNKLIVRRGLLGGVLSQGWPLLSERREVKLESAGTAKIGDRTLYKLKLTASGMGEMTVALYFEPGTFRHVRTEYSYRTGQLTSPNPNRPNQLGGTSPGYYLLTEDFSNFSKVDNLVLPLSYVLEYTTDAGKTLTWQINFSQAYNNQPLEASVFRVS
jgi:hypothetical protein